MRERQLALGVDAIAMQRPDRRLSGDGGPFESMLGFFTLKRERDRAHAGDEGAGHRHRRFARAFVANKLRGFECADETWAPSDPNLSTFAKSLVAKKPEAATTPEVAVKTVPKSEPHVESPDSVLDAREKAPAEVTHAETKADSEPDSEPAETAPAASLFAAFAAPAAAETAARKMSFADFGNAAPDENVSSSDEDVSSSDDDGSSSDDDEEGVVEDAAEANGEAAAGEDEALDVLGQLCELFVAENGRDPNDEEISQAQTLKEAAAEGLQM